MNKVVYFHETSGVALEYAINKFAKCHEILQISYQSSTSGKSCLVLYKDYDI